MSTALVVVAIVSVVTLALISVLVSARRRAATGLLTRETVARDAASASKMATDSIPGSDVETLGAEARTRSEDARGGLTGRRDRTPATLTPADLEVLGETRRQFLNRGALAGTLLGVGAFGASVLAFMTPGKASGSGFGGVVNIGTLAEIDDIIDNKKQPFYNAAAKTYVVKFPKADIAKAKALGSYKPIIGGIEDGYVALFQKCVHLGCRVPFCDTSQWFECPCHGSKYNRVGEKQGGPAPRGLDRFVLTISGDTMSVDTGNVIFGPPIGTNTTGQSPEGAPCV